MVSDPSSVPLQERYSALLLDLDGTVHRGPEPVEGAAEALLNARRLGHRLAFVTNNASRTPAQVVGHLAAVGIEAAEHEVLTSAQAGARALARMIPAGSRVLVVGGDGLVAAVEAEGLAVVADVTAEPVAVVQGWSPELAWPLLAEGAYALARGLPWVATNLDLTLPTARGEAPGNGSFVRLLAAVSGREPDVAAGKPEPMMLLAAAGSDGRRALVVGDRLDTDIAGAVAAGLDSLLVLTGVTDLQDLLAAAPHERPTYVSRDLSGLIAVPSTPAAVGDSSWVCGQARVSLVDDELVVGDAGTREDVLRALCVASWTSADVGRRASLGRTARARLGGADRS